MLFENVDLPLFELEKTKHSIRNSSPSWIQRPGSLSFSSLAESYVSAEVNGTLGIAVNYTKSLLEELCIRWTVLSTVYAHSLCCDWLAQVSVGLSTWTKHYVGSPGYVYISQNSQCSSITHSKGKYFSLPSQQPNWVFQDQETLFEEV